MDIYKMSTVKVCFTEIIWRHAPLALGKEVKKR